MPSTRYLEVQSKFFAKQDELAELLASARDDSGGYHGLDVKEAERHEQELNALADELKRIERLDEMHGRHASARDERRQLSATMIHAGPSGQGAPTGGHASLGEMVKDAWARHARTGRKQLDEEFACDMKGWLGLGVEAKATMLTTAGWAPEVTRIPRIAEKIAPGIELLDLFPVQTTDQSGVAWMEETTLTNAAVEIAEAALYPESALAFTERSSTVRKIGTRLPISDEQLADVPGLAQVVDGRLRFFVRKRLDLQVLAGDGIAPNLLGLLSTPGVQVQAVGADTVIDAVYKAIVKVRVTGQANPTAVIAHPNDLQPIRLLRTNNDVYVFGSPSDAGTTRLWGLPAVESTAITENTILVGDFTMAQLWIRQDATVELGYTDDQFIKGLQTLRASLRAALSTYRPEGFCMVTGA